MRIAVKIGTSMLTYPSGQLNIRRMETLCKVLSDIRNAGNEVIIISSGAIGMGVGKLGMHKRPTDMASKQACAAVGQCELMYFYDKLFSEYSYTTAQLLLTAEDLIENTANLPQGVEGKHLNRHENFTNTIFKLLELGVIPIINENDTIATEEIALGDNDTLGARVAISVQADLLVILTDIDGLYWSDPRVNPNAKHILEVHEITQEIRALAGGRGSELSSGGMATKLDAAKLCMDVGIDAVIVSGLQPTSLYDVISEKPVGTRFIGKKKMMSKDSSGLSAHLADKRE